MLLAAPTPIGPEETAGELAARLRVARRRRPDRHPRAARRADADARNATRTRRWRRASSARDGVLDWNRSARELVNLVRGCNPWPGALDAQRRRHAHDLARDRGWRRADDPRARWVGRDDADELAIATARRLGPSDRGAAREPPRDVAGRNICAAPASRRAPALGAVSRGAGRRRDATATRAPRASPARAVAARVLERVEADASFADLRARRRAARRAPPRARRRPGDRARRTARSAGSAISTGSWRRTPADGSRRSIPACGSSCE